MLSIFLLPYNLATSSSALAPTKVAFFTYWALVTWACLERCCDKVGSAKPVPVTLRTLLDSATPRWFRARHVYVPLSWGVTVNIVRVM